MKSTNLKELITKHLVLASLGSVLIVSAVIIVIGSFNAYAVTEEEAIIVYKSASCGCCTKWVDHLKANGFNVEARNTNNLNKIKKEAGLQPKLASCHTAYVDGYVIEGHVPASDIKMLLKERPDVTGLTVPGMPMGSPGMEGPRRDKYEVLTFDKAGKTTVFSRH
jgi:hypothetical protein